MTGFLFADDPTKSWWASGAEFNTTETHRYTLWRRWYPHQALARAGFLFGGTLVASDFAAPPWQAPGGAEPLVCWLMLNPSTADAEKLDPTLRRCQGFTEAWGFKGFVVCNLFGLRSTDPEGLHSVKDPVGPLNDEAIARVVDRCAITVAGWGVHGTFGDRDTKVRELLGKRPVWCLGRNKNGSPKHPLYVPAKVTPVSFSGEATQWRS